MRADLGHLGRRLMNCRRRTAFDPISVFLQIRILGNCTLAGNILSILGCSAMASTYGFVFRLSLSSM